MRAVALLTLTACIATTYEDATSWRALGHNRWLITVEGNGSTSTADIVVYENAAAKHVCPGGYDVEQQAGGVRNTGAVMVGSSVVATREADAAITVRCVTYCYEYVDSEGRSKQRCKWTKSACEKSYDSEDGAQGQCEKAE